MCKKGIFWGLPVTSVKFECAEPAVFSTTQRTLENIFGIPQNIKACVEKAFFESYL